MVSGSSERVPIRKQTLMYPILRGIPRRTRGLRRLSQAAPNRRQRLFRRQADLNHGSLQRRALHASQRRDPNDPRPLQVRRQA